MDIASVSSMVPAITSLYGLLFGFTFIIIQQFFKPLPRWMIKSVLKNAYFLIFIFLYPFTLIIYCLLLLGILPSNFIKLFIIFFVIDVIYTVPYVFGMLHLLHPNTLFENIKNEIDQAKKSSEGEKCKKHLQNAYSGIECMMKENIIGVSEVSDLIYYLKSFYEKNNSSQENMEIFTKWLLTDLINPFQRYLIERHLINHDAMLELKDIISLIGSIGIYAKNNLPEYEDILRRVQLRLEYILKRSKDEEIKKIVSKVMKEILNKEIDDQK